MKLSSFMAFLFFAIGIIFFVTVVFEITMPLPVYLLLFAALAAGIPLFGLFIITKKERYYAQEDMIIPRPDHNKHIIAIGVFLLISVFGALVFSSNKSVFPPSLVSGFIFRFFKYNAPEIEAEKAPVESPGVLESFFSSLGKIEQSSSLPIRKWLQYGFIILIAAGFLLLIIIPRVYHNKAFRKIPIVNQSVLDSIKEWFRGVLLALSSIFIRKKRPLKRNKTSAAEILSTARAILASYSPAKKKNMQESVTLFARLIIWGGKARQVFWKPAHAPMEYCGLLTAALPEWNLNCGIIRCGELFEQALYSSQILSDEERKEFAGLVKEITEENLNS